MGKDDDQLHQWIVEQAFPESKHTMISTVFITNNPGRLNDAIRFSYHTKSRNGMAMFLKHPTPRRARINKLKNRTFLASKFVQLRDFTHLFLDWVFLTSEEISIIN